MIALSLSRDWDKRIRTAIASSTLSPANREGDFCITSISSTPKNAGNHAKQLRRVVDNCIRWKQAQEEDDE